MQRLRSMAIACGVFALVLTACSGGSTGSKSAANGVLLHASDLPDMRLESESGLLTEPNELSEPLGHGEIFKIEAPAIEAKLMEWGFTRAHLERFLGGGTHAVAGVGQFASPAEARTAVDFMYQQLFQPCPGVPQCASQIPLTVSGIPGAKAQRVTPFRESQAGNPFTDYKVLFSIGPLVYAIDIGGDGDFYDPGTVSQSTAEAVFKDVYERVKDLSPDAVFKLAPTNPIGPIPQGAVSGSPPPGAPSP